MKKWKSRTSLYLRLAAILVAFCIVSLTANTSHAGWKNNDTHIECYSRSEFPAGTAGDTSYETLKRPKYVYIVRAGDLKLNLHQAVCDSRDSSWYYPAVRVVYMVAGRQHRRDLTPGECKWIVGLRFCARMAYPVEGKDNFGNKTGKEGEGPMKPQLCAYVDGMDGGDTKGGSSPYHYRTPQHTIYEGLPTGIKVLLGPIGALVGAINSTKNHFVRRDLGCVDRQIAVGPPPWENNRWNRQQFAAPFIDYAETSTFRSPTINLHFCELDRINDTNVGITVSEDTLCGFEKDNNGEYIRGIGGPGVPAGPYALTPLEDMEVVETLTLTPGPDALAEVATDSETDRHGRVYEARISSVSPDVICVYKTQEVDGTDVDQIQGCLPRPGYMPLPIVQQLAAPGLAPNPTYGMFGLTLNVSFPLMPGSIDLQYIGDYDYTDPLNPVLIERCDTLHQITFCAKPGPVTDPIENTSETTTMNTHPITGLPLVPPLPPKTTRYRGWLCIEGYDTAPPTAGTEYREVETFVFDHNGQIVYVPPLPDELAVPVLKYDQESDTIPSNPPNIFAAGDPGGDIFPNYAAQRELVSGVPSVPMIDPPLTKDAWYYDPPCTQNDVKDLVGPDPCPDSIPGTPPIESEPRPIDVLDPYFVDGTARFDYDGDTNLDIALLRPMTPMELGLCVEMMIEEVKTHAPITDTWTEFPTPAGLAAIDWSSWDPADPGSFPPKSINEIYTPPADCSEVEVEVWGSGGGATSRDSAPTLLPTLTIDSAIYTAGTADPLVANQVQFVATVGGTDTFTSQPITLLGASLDPAIIPPAAPVPNGSGDNGLGAGMPLPHLSDLSDNGVEDPDDPSLHITFVDDADPGRTFVLDVGNTTPNINNAPDANTVAGSYNLAISALSQASIELIIGSVITPAVVTSEDHSGGSGAYIKTTYDLKPLGMVNAPIPVSVGVGGMYRYEDDHNRTGINGYRSAFGINNNMVVAEGGKGFDTYTGGTVAQCQNPAICSGTVTQPGQDGTPAPDECQKFEGGLVWGGDANPSYVGPGLAQCDRGGNDPYDEHIHNNTGLGAGQAPGQRHHPLNILFPGTSGAPPMTPSDHAGAGGCVADKCEKCVGVLTRALFGIEICYPRLFQGSTETWVRQDGHAGVGGHGKIRVRCIEGETRTSTPTVSP